MNSFEHAILSDIRTRENAKASPKLNPRARKLAERMATKGWIDITSGYRLTPEGRKQLDSYNQKAQQPMRLRGMNGAGGIK